MKTTREWHKLFYGMVAVFSLLALLAAGCSGGGGGNGDSGDLSGDPTGSDTLTGVFADSPVEGIRYETPTETGFTDAEGKFQYREDETVRFSLGDAEFGEAPAEPYMTPMDLVEGAEDVDDWAVTNMARFLQGLDEDGDPENGIQIPEEAEEALSGRPIGFRTDVGAFEVDAHVQGVFDELNERGAFGNGQGRGLRGVEVARQHMRENLPEDWQGPPEPWRPGDDDVYDDGTAEVLPKFLDKNENGINDYVEEATHYPAGGPEAEGRQAWMAQRQPGDDEMPMPDGVEPPLPEEDYPPIPGEDEVPMPEEDDPQIPDDVDLPLPGEEVPPIPDEDEVPTPEEEYPQIPDDVDLPLPEEEVPPIPGEDEVPMPEEDVPPIPEDVEIPDSGDQDDADDATNHGHEFVDENGDGICDLAQDGSNTWHGPGFVDKDGDGVCDYWDPDQRRHNRHAGMPFIDENEDGVNDLFQFGTHEGPDHEFVDENGDGICDRAQDSSNAWHGPMFDDEDGDGASDHWEEGGRGHGHRPEHAPGPPAV